MGRVSPKARRTISFTTHGPVRTFDFVRALLLLAGFLFGIAAAQAQEQEKKLIDRLLQPDMELQNRAAQKQFVPTGKSLAKTARTKPFRVQKRAPEKQFADTRAFGVRNFGTRTSRSEKVEANLTPRSSLEKFKRDYPSTAYRGVRSARDAEKKIEVSEFTGTRRFLVRGKSQKALSQQDRPLTIDQVRELLNKTK